MSVEVKYTIQYVAADSQQAIRKSKLKLRNSSPHLILSGAERVELIITAWLRLDFYNWAVIKNNDSVLGTIHLGSEGAGQKHGFLIAFSLKRKHISRFNSSDVVSMVHSTE